MQFSNPVKGPIHISAQYYPKAPGAWVRPSGNTDFAVTQDWGPSELSVEPTRDYVSDGHEYDIYGKLVPSGYYPDFHQGLDLGNKGCGAAILAAGPGTVEAVGIDSAGGHYIIINHGYQNGLLFRTRYWHCATQSVAKGAKVVAGQAIGTVGATGLASGCHLHFEVTINGKSVDPWRRLKQNGYADPDAAPAPTGEDMILTKYLPLYGITVPKGYNIRKDPSTANAAIRLTSAPEPWSILGTVKGQLVSGNDQWYVRVNGLAFEYVWSGNIAAPVAPAPPAPPVDTTPYSQAEMDAAKAALDAAQAKIDKAKADLA